MFFRIIEPDVVSFVLFIHSMLMKRCILRWERFSSTVLRVTVTLHEQLLACEDKPFS